MNDDALQGDASVTSDTSEAPTTVDPTAEQAQPTAPEESDAPEAQAGEDTSTAPPTAPAPLPGVPVKPINAERRDTDPVPAVLQPSRIGEAIAQQQKVEADAKSA